MIEFSLERNMYVYAISICNRSLIVIFPYFNSIAPVMELEILLLRKVFLIASFLYRFTSLLRTAATCEQTKSCYTFRLYFIYVQNLAN